MHFKLNKIQLIPILTYFALTLTFSSCGESQQENPEEIIAETRKEYAPDKRVALFDVSYEDGILVGETNLPQALEDLKHRLDERGINYLDQVEILPNMEGDKNFGLVTISVANIRSAPKHSAELATQATMGTPVNVLKKEDGWYLIQTPDQYISWVDAAGIEIMTQKEMENWNEASKIVFTSLVGYVFSDESRASMVSDLTAGNVLELLQERGNAYEVKLPDGRIGFVDKSMSEPLHTWLASRETSHENLISTAKNMMGVPYLWGGTSIKGVDCSGFTKTIFFLNGQVIPRDASQQIHEGEEVDREKDWENLQVGDLLFFGKPATDTTPERVIHVGMWIGNNEFIHSRGRVRISSFDPESEHYDEYELNRYLRTKRVLGKESQNILAVEKFIQ
ncbi:C40 family peptidase [Litoribacter ruber]|uniref:C40 family peptidase n=1 Tax=Litoribacter ruber TaxID=702568 RepID=UPI001BDAE0AE|nr:C40 family peptidase [Litoribacter ruber]MBT0810211.1 C40 family peptidase [Litoribacter ruber]